MTQVTFKLIMPILCSLLLLTNCTKDFEVIPNGAAEQELILERLNCAGFKTENIEVHDDYVVVEGHMVMSKADILRSSYMSENPSAGKTDAWITDPGTVVNITTGGNIYYYIQPSMVNLVEGSEWVTAIGNATSQWNNIQNCRVHFSQTLSESSADIIFYPIKGLYYNGTGYSTNPNITLPNFPALPACTTTKCETGLYAKSAYPVNFEVGRWVVITDCSDDDLNLTQKTNTIAHELGHVLGFRHSDFGCALNIDVAYEFSCPDSPILGANLLFGTPACDTNSLMFPGSYDKTFTDYDKKATRMVYPASNSSYTPTITTLVIGICGAHCRVWNAYVHNPLPWYAFRLRLKNTATNQFVAFGDITAGNSATTALSYSVPGNYTIQLLGTNYQGDITCYSPSRSVVIP